MKSNKLVIAVATAMLAATGPALADGLLGVGAAANVDAAVGARAGLGGAAGAAGSLAGGVADTARQTGRAAGESVRGVAHEAAAVRNEAAVEAGLRAEAGGRAAAGARGEAAAAGHASDSALEHASDKARGLYGTTHDQAGKASSGRGEREPARESRPRRGDVNAAAQGRVDAEAEVGSNVGVKASAGADARAQARH